MAMLKIGIGRIQINYENVTYLNTKLLTFKIAIKLYLLGMWINLTKKPMKPIIAKPTAVAKAIFWYSKNEEINPNK
jgi:hypothetical protein